MQIGSFDIDLEDNRIYKPLEISTKILSQEGGDYFFALCNDFNSSSWHAEMIYGTLFEKYGEVYIEFSDDCIELLLDARDESLDETAVYDFINQIENTPIGKLEESNRILINPDEQENIDIYVVSKNETSTIYALYAKTVEERLLNKAVIFADLFDHANIRTGISLKKFAEEIKKNYREFMGTEYDPFRTQPKFEPMFDNLPEELELEGEDWEYVDDAKPVKIVPFPHKPC